MLSKKRPHIYILYEGPVHEFMHGGGGTMGSWLVAGDGVGGTSGGWPLVPKEGASPQPP